MTEPNFAARNQTDVLVQERKDVLIVRWMIGCAPIGVFAVVLAIFAQSIPRPLPPGVGPLLMVLAAAFAVASVLLPRRLMSDKHLAARLQQPINAHRWARAMRLRGTHTDTFIALPPEEQRLLGLTILFERPNTLGLALGDAVAAIGLVYGLLSKTMPEAAPFLLGAVALNCWHYPRLKPLIERGRKLDRHEEEQEALNLLAKLKTAAEPPPKPAPRTQPKLRRPSRAQGPGK